jgi:hypothetical protein
MNFISFKFHGHQYRLWPTVGGAAAIGFSLLILAIAHPVLAKSATPPAKSPQAIALKLKHATGTAAIVNSSKDFRLLGYGLFLLQIGLIPLKFAKGNQVQTMTFGRSETNAAD